MLTEETRAKIIELSKTDASFRQIAMQLNVGKTTVSSIIKKHKSTPEEEMNGQFLNVIKPTNSEDDAFVASFAAKLDEPVKKRTKAPKKVSGLIDDLLDRSITKVVKAQPTDEDKAKLISKISLTANNFEVVLKDYLKPDKDTFLSALHKKSASELESISKTLDHSRAVGNLSNQMKYMMFMAASGVEFIGGKFLKLRTQGYADTIRAQEAEIQSILKEIALENVEKFQTYQRPEIRLATIFATSLLAVDTKNRMSELSSKQLNPDLEEKFSEL